MVSLPTGTVTFLFTDIEGSTALLERLSDRQYAAVLAEHQRLLRDAFAKGNGQEVDTQGDAFLVAFSRARDAVATAVAAQRALTRHAWPDGAAPRVRMGLHTGEPVSGGTSYVGMDVHRASRIAAAGHGGQILLSDAVSGLAARDLPPGVSLRDLGTHRLKDLREPEHLLQVVHPDLPADFPPVKTLDVLPNNLPVQLTSFIGREREKAEVRRLLSSTRFLTLTGSGGAGKTRLALQVAAEVLEGFPDGVWLVELAALSDPILVPKAVASALGVPEQPGRLLTETLAHALRAKSVLIVLDNCEHLVAACAHLTTGLLRVCPNLRILATSREALGVAGETTWRVPSLSVPDPQGLPPLDRFREYEAIRLFIDRAMTSEPHFAVTSSNAPAVALVCHRLDGIPLALELAAARVKVLAVEQIVARLDDRFRLLTGGSRTALPRQQTLRAAMDWSYDLLSEPERALLRRLSVFAGGWTLDAAETICAGGGIESQDVLDLLTRLVDKSLVVVEPPRGEARYRLLETVRQFARDRLVESGETAEVRGRHRDWFLALAERHLPRYEPYVSDPDLLERIDRDYENLRAALEWSATEEAGAQAVLRLAGALAPFWHNRGYYADGRRWLDGALARSHEAPPAARTQALGGAATLAWRQADYELAWQFAEQSEALARRQGDKEATAHGLMMLGLIVLRRDQDFPRATALFEEALTLARGRGDHKQIGLVLAQLGATARYQGEYDRAAAFVEESLAEFKAVSALGQIGYALRLLGHVRLAQGDLDGAAALYTDSLRFRGVPSFVRTECLEGLAGVSAGRGQHQRAARLFGAADAIRETIGFPRPAPDWDHYERRVAAVRAALGDAVFGTAVAQGRAMTLEQAIEYALAPEPG